MRFIRYFPDMPLGGVAIERIGVSTGGRAVPAKNKSTYPTTSQTFPDVSSWSFDAVDAVVPLSAGLKVYIANQRSEPAKAIAQLGRWSGGRLLLE